MITTIASTSRARRTSFSLPLEKWLRAIKPEANQKFVHQYSL